jgi:hypothetical protein
MRGGIGAVEIRGYRIFCAILSGYLYLIPEILKLRTISLSRPDKLI